MVYFHQGVTSLDVVTRSCPPNVLLVTPLNLKGYFWPGDKCHCQTHISTSHKGFSIRNTAGFACLNFRVLIVSRTIQKSL